MRETLKTAIAHASGKYIAFLESDDRWDPKNLAIKVNALEQHPQAALVDDAVELFGNTDLFARYEQYWQLRNKLLSKKSFPANIYKELFTENIIPTFSCVICRTNVLKGCSFDYIYPAHLDRSLWLQICKNNLFYHIDLPLTFWRIHDSSYISLESKKYRKNLIFKIYMLLKPCYQGGFLNPLLHTAVIRFVAVNLLRSIKNRFTKPKN